MTECKPGRLRIPAVILAAVMALGALSCGGGGKQKPATDVGAGDWEVTVESGDTTWTPAPAGAETTAAVAPDTVAAADSLAPPEPAPPVRVPDPREFTPGWRVQISASETMGGAEAVRKEAVKQASEPVYIEYEPPYYKVRVGDFLSKAEAESMATRLRAEGFDTWVVETLVLKPGR